MENLVNELYVEASRQTLERTPATTLVLESMFKGTCVSTKQAFSGSSKSFSVDKWFHLENFLLHLAKHTQQPHNFSFSSSFDILWENLDLVFFFHLQYFYDLMKGFVKMKEMRLFAFHEANGEHVLGKLKFLRKRKGEIKDFLEHFLENFF